MEERFHLISFVSHQGVGRRYRLAGQALYSRSLALRLDASPEAIDGAFRGLTEQRHELGQ
jgi:hypothetical protein